MQPTKVQVVLYRQSETDLEPQVLIMEKQVNGHAVWTLITGFIEEDETPAAAAMREVLEESGLEELSQPIDLDNDITFTSKYTGEKEHEKAFAIESLNPAEEVVLSKNPDQEHVGFRWVDPEEAFILLQFDSFKESIHSLLQTVGE